MRFLLDREPRHASDYEIISTEAFVSRFRVGPVSTDLRVVASVTDTPWTGKTHGEIDALDKQHIVTGVSGEPLTILVGLIYTASQ